MRWASATAGRTRLATLAVSALATGCSFTADPGAARFACDSLTVCPDGVACVDGYCQVPTEAAGDAATSTQLDGGGEGDGGDPSGAIAWRSVAVGSADNMLVDRITTEQALSGQDGDVYVAFVSTKPAHDVSSISGLGLDWHELRQQCSGRSTASLAAFWARATGQANGRVTATLPGGGAGGSILLAVHRYGGADPDDPIGSASSANSNGADGDADCFGGEDTPAYSWSKLDTGAPGSVVLSGAHTANYANHTPGDAFTERSDDQSGDTSSSAGVAVQDRLVPQPTSNVTVTGGWPGEEPDWAVIAVELRD